MNTTNQRTSRSKIHLAAPSRLVWLLVGVIILWGVWAFGSEAVLTLRLNQQVNELQAENDQLARENAQTQLQLAAAATPKQLEELARQQGYALPGEKLYVIVTPQAQPPASPAVRQAAGTTPAKASVRAKRQGGGPWQAFARWWHNLWH